MYVVTVLFLVSLPFPQVVEHSLHGDQSVTLQSTGYIDIEVLNN